MALKRHSCFVRHKAQSLLLKHHSSPLGCQLSQRTNSLSRTVSRKRFNFSTRKINPKVNLSGKMTQKPKKEVYVFDTMDQTAPPSPLGSMSFRSTSDYTSDGYDSDVTSQLSTKFREEMEKAERLDAQLLECVQHGIMKPRADTDSAAGGLRHKQVSPEIQNMLNMAHQGNCQMRSLAEKFATFLRKHRVSDVSVHSLDQNQHQSGDGSSLLDHSDQSPSHPSMTSEQENRSLQETVTVQRELLCETAQKHTQAVSVQRSEVTALQGQLEQERAACSILRRELQIERSQRMLLQKHLADTQKELEVERQRSAQQKALSFQKERRLECLLMEAESHIAEMRAELLQSRRRWEEEQKEEVSRALEEERERLKETVRLLQNKVMEMQERVKRNEPNQSSKSDLMQRLYERYLRAESRRKALVNQKSFLQYEVQKHQTCEQEVARLLAEMGSRPSPRCTSRLSPLGRFRAAVRAVIAVSRMRLLNRKWQTAVNRSSQPGTVHGQAPGSSHQKTSSLWTNAQYIVFVKPK